MKVTIEPTAEFTSVNGVRCRLWQGTTDAGTPIRLAVLRASVAEECIPELQRAGLVPMPPRCEVLLQDR